MKMFNIVFMLFGLLFIVNADLMRLKRNDHNIQKVLDAHHPSALFKQHKKGKTHGRMKVVDASLYLDNFVKNMDVAIPLFTNKGVAVSYDSAIMQAGSAAIVYGCRLAPQDQPHDFDMWLESLRGGGIPKENVNNDPEIFALHEHNNKVIGIEILQDTIDNGVCKSPSTACGGVTTELDFRDGDGPPVKGNPTPYKNYWRDSTGAMDPSKIVTIQWQGHPINLLNCAGVSGMKAALIAQNARDRCHLADDAPEKEVDECYERKHRQDLADKKCMDEMIAAGTCTAAALLPKLLALQAAGNNGNANKQKQQQMQQVLGF